MVVPAGKGSRTGLAPRSIRMKGVKSGHQTRWKPKRLVDPAEPKSNEKKFSEEEESKSQPNVGESECRTFVRPVIQIETGSLATSKADTNVSAPVTPENIASRNHRVVTLGFPLSSKLLVELNRKFPDFTFQGNDHGRPHTHPMSAIERLVCEELVVQDLKRHGCYKIIDIGGNPIRHYKNKRDIHSCCPELSAKDSCRIANILTTEPNVASWCSHTAQACGCLGLEVDAYMSVHSLYYLKPEDVLMLLKRTRCQRLVAVVHAFDHLRGHFHWNGDGYESQYESRGEDVQMKVTGNQYVYDHKNPRWLRNGYFSGIYGSMAWDTRVVGDSLIYTFVNAKQGLKGERSRMSLVSKLNDSAHFDDEAHDALDLDEHYAPKFQYKSFGPFCWLKASSGKDREPVVVSKKIICEVALHIAGRKRDTNVLAEAVNRAKKLLKEDDQMKPLDKARGASLAGCMAFVLTLQDDIDALVSQVQPQARKMGLFNRLLNWEWFQICGSSEPEWNTIVRRKSWSTWLRDGACFGGPAEFSAEDPLRYYNSTRGITAPKVSLTACEEGPWHGVNVKPVLKPMRKGARLSLPSGISEYEKTTNKMWQIAPHVGNRIPVVPESTIEHEQQGLHNRVLCEVPQANEELWEQVWNHWEGMRILNSPIEEIIPLKFDEWNKNFPSARQKQHLKAIENLRHRGLEDRDFERKLFNKLEKYVKGGDEVEDFDNRIISGASHEANVVLAPWIASFNIFLKKYWTIGSQVTYASGMSAERIGDWLTNAIEELGFDVVFIECDFSRFDLTIGRLAYQFEGRVYDQAGLHNYPDARLVFSRQCKKVGYTRHGIRFSVDGGRNSGDPNTSCGNSLINGVCQSFAFERVCGTKEYRLIVLGDDSFMVVNSRAVQPYLVELQERMCDTLAGLGFKPKLKVTDDLAKAEFCSGLFWPIEGFNRYVLGAKPGKLLNKIAFVANKRLSKNEERSCLIGHWINNAHVPVVSQYLRHVIKFQIDERKAQKNQYKINAERAHELSQKAISMFEDRYGLVYENCVAEMRILVRARKLDHIALSFMEVMDGVDN